MIVLQQLKNYINTNTATIRIYDLTYVGQLLKHAKLIVDTRERLPQQKNVVNA